MFSSLFSDLLKPINRTSLQVVMFFLIIAPFDNTGAVSKKSDYFQARLHDGVIYMDLSEERGDETFRFVIDPASYRTIMPARTVDRLCEKKVRTFESEGQQYGLIMYNGCKEIGPFDRAGVMRNPIVFDPPNPPNAPNASKPKNTTIKILYDSDEKANKDFRNMYGASVDGVLGTGWLCHKTLYVDLNKQEVRVYNGSRAIKNTEHRMPLHFATTTQDSEGVQTSCQGYPFSGMPTAFDPLVTDGPVGFQYYLTLGRESSNAELFIDNKILKEESELFIKEGLHWSTRLWAGSKPEPWSWYMRNFERGTYLLSKLNARWLLFSLNYFSRWRVKLEQDDHPLLISPVQLRVSNKRKMISHLLAVQRINADDKESVTDQSDSVTSAIDLSKAFSVFAIDFEKKQLSGYWRVRELEDGGEEMAAEGYSHFGQHSQTKGFSTY